MYGIVEGVVPDLAELCQRGQSIWAVSRGNVEGGEREEDFDCCSL